MDTDDEYVDVVQADERLSQEVRELLADPHVRYLLTYLQDQNGPVPLSRAAIHVGAGVTDTPPEDVPDGVRDRVETLLHRGPVPELARHGIVEFDHERDAVSLKR